MMPTLESLAKLGSPALPISAIDQGSSIPLKRRAKYFPVFGLRRTPMSSGSFLEAIYDIVVDVADMQARHGILPMNKGI